MSIYDLKNQEDDLIEDVEKRSDGPVTEFEVSFNRSVMESVSYGLSSGKAQADRSRDSGPFAYGWRNTKSDEED